MAVKDRIKELRRVRAGDLLANPRNWRTHPESQASAVRALLKDIGWADALIARETDAGLELLDGHLRAGLDEDQTVPVLVVDLDDDEAAKYLLSADPLAQMAEADQSALKNLLEHVAADAGPELADLMDRIRTEHLVLELADVGTVGDELRGAPVPRGELPEGIEPSHVRMVQLFFDDTTHPEFVTMEAALRVQYGTANATDTVRACLKECFEKRSATADTD